MVEDPKELFTLGVVRKDCFSLGGLASGLGLAYRADDLAGLVNHGDRLAEGRHGR